jgi:hypothetical protein
MPGVLRLKGGQLASALVRPRRLRKPGATPTQGLRAVLGGASLGGATDRDRSARRSRLHGWDGSSEHPPPARGQRWLGLGDGGLHAGGEEQCADRHPALQAGIYLAGGLYPVGQLTGADKRGRENDLAGEQTV